MLRKQKKLSSDAEQLPFVVPAKKRKDIAENNLAKKVFGGEDELLKTLSSSEKSQKSRSNRAEIVKKLNSETKRPVWHDEDDDDKPAMVEKLSGRPNWAQQSYINSDSESDDEVARSTGTHLVTSAALAPSILQINSCPNANGQSTNTGKITSVRFHPTHPVVMTASMDQTVRFFQVDGKINAKIQNVCIDNFPIVSAEFCKQGEEVIMGSKYRSFYYFDVLASKVVCVQKVKNLHDTMGRFKVTPDHHLIVFMGSAGNLHIFSARTKEWIHTLNMNGNVVDICFSPDSKTMFATGDDGKVFVFDLKMRHCVHHFYDDGCVHGTSICMSKDGQYLVCGSNTGVVNIYERESCLVSQTPRPLKAIMNLTTSCSAAVFNPTTEILALASDMTEKAVKLVHFPSFSVFSNYPEMTDSKIRIPISMDFSPHSGYFAIGNQKGHALLYRLKHYSGY